MRIAMWSGPRNISTAMMYSFGNRADFAAWDEPFYAPYLAATGLEHPLREQIIAGHETDPVKVAERCVGAIKGGSKHLYMKHMPLHMLEGFPLAWAEACVNVHLIRHPARVVASYAAKRENPQAGDLGYAQQTDLFERLPGPVLDSADIRADPEHILKKLCAIIGLSFDATMLRWPAGPKRFDGVWAPHWYGAVHRSTGFAGPEVPMPDVGPHLSHLVDSALPHYRALEARKIV